MIEFFDYLPSQNAFKVRTLLHQLRIPHATTFVSIFEGAGQRPEYLRVNPTGAVPAIRLADGKVLAESNAILGYLAEGSRYLPEDPFGRAKVNQWLSFEQDYVQNSIGSLRYWTMTGKQRPDELVASKRSAALRALSILERELAARPYICGDGYTIADLALYAYASRAEVAGIALQPHPHFLAWVTRVESQEGFANEVHPYSIDPYSSRELP
jgi:glutathione S-transferase